MQLAVRSLLFLLCHSVSAINQKFVDEFPQSMVKGFFSVCCENHILRVLYSFFFNHPIMRRNTNLWDIGIVI